MSARVLSFLSVLAVAVVVALSSLSLLAMRVTSGSDAQAVPPACKRPTRLRGPEAYAAGEVLARWVQAKGIVPMDMRSGRMKSDEIVAFIASRNAAYRVVLRRKCLGRPFRVTQVEVGR